MVDERIVLCMKWGTLYPSDYVNVLYNACRKNLTGEWRFVCLTDDATGFLPEIETFDIPDIGLEESEWYTKGVWPKLALYVADLHGLKGRCLFIDLDMMVVGDLDPMFEFSKGFVTVDIGGNWYPGGDGTAERDVGTSVFAFDFGQENQILDTFLADKAAAKRDFLNEQQFVGKYAKSMDYWPAEWVISFKRHLRQPMFIDLFRPPRAPGPEVKIVTFHGDPRPITLVPEKAGFWDRPPHMGHGQVKWVADYWLENGGRMPPFE